MDEQICLGVEAIRKLVCLHPWLQAISISLAATDYCPEHWSRHENRETLCLFQWVPSNSSQLILLDDNILSSWSQPGDQSQAWQRREAETNNMLEPKGGSHIPHATDEEEVTDVHVVRLPDGQDFVKYSA